MDGNKPKEGVSVKEIEEFAKRHRYEVFFCLMFLFACIFSLVGYFRGGWSIFFAMGGGILGVIFPVKTDAMLKMIFQFIFKQDLTLQIVLGVVGLILAIFVPFIIFLAVGLAGGRSMAQMAA
jgi:hypothetical protein